MQRSKPIPAGSPGVSAIR